MRSSRLLLTLSVLAVLALVAPASAGDAEVVTAGPPTDYTAIEGLSEIRFSGDEILTEVVRLPMRDGVEIYIEITRPDVEDERFPVILEASPYHGTIATRIGDRIFPDPKDSQGRPVGLVGYFAPRGYAVAMMGLRGTGRSQGCIDHMGPNDARDLAETIEWLAEQPWSNGRIGMTGHSYVGSTPMIAASQDPEGLVTIVPSAGIARAYDHQFQHGVAYQGQWLGLPYSYNMLAMDRHLPVGVAGPGGDNFGNDMQYFGCGWTTSSFQEGHRQITGEMGPFHAVRDHTKGAIAWDGPVFLVQGAYDVAVRPPAMEWFNQRRDPRDKLWYGQFDHGSGVHPNRRGWQWVGALHAWFDKHLQGRPVDTGPPVEVFVNGARTRNAAISAHEQVFTDRVWPTKAQLWSLFPDAATGALSKERPASASSVTFRGNGAGAIYARSGNLGETVLFASEPLDRDTLLVGIPELRLVASATNQNTDVIVRLLDQGPDGSRRQLSEFAINPALRGSLAAPAPVVPDQPYVMRPPGWPVAHNVPAGHQLVLIASTWSDDKAGFNANDPRVGIYTGPLGTELKLPVVDGGVLYDDVLRR